MRIRVITNASIRPSNGFLVFCFLSGLTGLAILFLSIQFNYFNSTQICKTKHSNVEWDLLESIMPTFRVSSRNFQLLAAYLDHRLPSETWITIIGVKWIKAAHHRLLTHQIELQGLSVTLFSEPRAASEVQFWSEDEKFHPHQYKTTVWRWGPFNVTQISTGTNMTLHLIDSDRFNESRSLVSLQLIPPLAQLSPKYNFTICLAPLYGKISATRIQHFMEMSAALGMEHVYVYQHAAAPPVEESQHQGRLETTLQYYAGHRMPSLASLTKLSFKPPADLGLYYWGQITAYAHCLHRAMLESSFTLFTDLDEVLVPRPSYHVTTSPPVTAWRGLVNSIGFGAAGDRRCGLCFPMHMFLYKSNDFRPWYFTYFRRNKSYSLYKCLVRPALVYDMEVHSVRSCLPGWVHYHHDGSGVAVIQHYRNTSKLCSSPQDRKHNQCTFETVDDTLMRYKNDFEKNMKRLENDKRSLLLKFNIIF